ncbi:hypothetical protein HO173_005823 [Letharia columbiana]|uniref:C2H2-type domain-containing protein n=1 Tax=Letharia columbiana TaxID=112416 RepID=A0A8H6L5B8_9LECA|nr:uncharacterized protein HO173_005823 [Letharia columbiana]KAF6236194.1 hypothetical protein HO173_005823 [Letharia columbiana]
MSQQLLLDISSATARSKGQARRRNQPTESEGARKAQRNLARRERARCKMTARTEQLLLSSAQPSLYADRPQYGAPVSINDKVPRELPEIHLQPHRPAFTVLPAHANEFNLRALAQSSRYIAAQSKAQEAKDVVRDDLQQVGGVSVIQARDGSQSRITPEEQDRDVAEILVEVAREQHPASTVMDTETNSVNTGGEPEADASMEYSRKCPVATCEFHRKGFPRKAERDKHTMTHFEGSFNWGYELCGRSYSFEILDNIEDLRHHVRGSTHLSSFRELERFKCYVCTRVFDRSGYLEHMDDCMVHTVELEASGRARACPVPFCDHHLMDFPSKYLIGQHLIRHYSELLVYGWKKLQCPCCYDLQRYCSSVDEFRSHVARAHKPIFGRISCPICRHGCADNTEFFEHLDRCMIHQVELEAFEADL